MLKDRKRCKNHEHREDNVRVLVVERDNEESNFVIVNIHCLCKTLGLFLVNITGNIINKNLEIY